MAPDIDDAEALITQMEGTENAWEGRVLLRLVRTARTALAGVVALRNRVDQLEQRIAALEQPPPQ